MIVTRIGSVCGIAGYCSRRLEFLDAQRAFGEVSRWHGRCDCDCDCDRDRFFYCEICFSSVSSVGGFFLDHGRYFGMKVLVNSLNHLERYVFVLLVVRCPFWTLIGCRVICTGHTITGCAVRFGDLQFTLDATFRVSFVVFATFVKIWKVRRELPVLACSVAQ